MLRISSGRVERRLLRRSLLPLAAGAGAGALLEPGGHLAGAVLLTATLISWGHLRVKGAGDEVAAAAMRWRVPVGGGFVAGGVTYSYLYLVLVSPRALARQVGLPADDPRIKAILAVALAAFALPLLATWALQRWLPGESSGSRTVCTALLVTGGAGAIAIPLAPTWWSLYGAIILGGACGAGGAMLKCRIAAAARTLGRMNKAVTLMMASNVLALVAFPFGTAQLIHLAPDVGGVRAHGLAFAALGTCVLAAWAFVPPLLRGWDAGTLEASPVAMTRDRRLWRGIAVSAGSMGGLGAVDAGIVFIIAAHTGGADAEFWAGFALLSSLPLAVVAYFFEPLMKRRMRLIAVLGAGMGLAGAAIGFAAQGLHGVAWGIAFLVAYAILFEPSTTLLLMLAEWVAIQNPANYARVALVTGIRQAVKAITAFVFLAGESPSWLVGVALGIPVLVVAAFRWDEVRPEGGGLRRAFAKRRAPSPELAVSTANP